MRDLYALLLAVNVGIAMVNGGAARRRLSEKIRSMTDLQVCPRRVTV
jgi:hypothetical protein